MLLNTAVLLISGVLLVVAYRIYKHHSALQAVVSGASPRASGRRALPLYALGSLLGAAFVVLQGREWAALLAMSIGAVKLLRGTMGRGYFLAVVTFWTFVVGMWPVIYLRVYF